MSIPNVSPPEPKSCSPFAYLLHSLQEPCLLNCWLDGHPTTAKLLSTTIDLGKGQDCLPLANLLNLNIKEFHFYSQQSLDGNRILSYPSMAGLFPWKVVSHLHPLNLGTLQLLFSEPCCALHSTSLLVLSPMQLSQPQMNFWWCIGGGVCSQIA